MKQLLFFAWIVILGSKLVFAQESSVLSGQLLDFESRQPVQNAFVNLVEKDSLRLLAFVQADSKGRFRLKLPPMKKHSELLLSSEALGYEARTLSLDSLMIEKPLSIYLHPTSFYLKEVLIEDIPPVKQSLDTLSFDPRSYMDSTERKLEDLLAKLPGVDVGKDGKVKLGNKEIKSILIDGDDLGGSDYRLISQNMPIELVKRLEFISNYVENTLLAGFDAPEFLVLNVETDKEKTQKPSLNLELGIGNANTQLASSNSLAFLKKIKIINVNQFQSLGKEVQPPLTKPWEGLAGIAPSHPVINGRHKEMAYQQPTIGIPSEFIPASFNRSAWSSIRLHAKPNKYLKSFVEVTGLHEGVDQYMDISRTFFSQGINSRLEESYELGRQKKELQIQIKNQLYTGKKSNLTSFSAVTLTGNRASSGLDLGSNNFDVSIGDRLSAQDHRIAWIKKLNHQNILILDGGLSHRNFSQQTHIQSLIAREFGTQQLGNNGSQLLASSLRSSSANLRWIRKISNFLFVHAAIRGGEKQQAFQSTIYSHSAINAEAKIRYQTPGSLFVVANLHLGYLNLGLTHQKEGGFSQRLNAPLLHGQVWLGKKKLTYNWNLSYSFAQRLPDLDQVNQDMFWDSYRSQSRGDSSLALGSQHEWQARASFLPKLGRVNHFTAYGQVSFSISELPYQNSFLLDSLYVSNQWERGNSRLESLQIQLGIEKYISPLKTALKLRPSYTLNRYNNSLQDIDRMLTSSNFGLSSTLRTATSSFVDVMFGEEASWNVISIESESFSSQGNAVQSYSISAFADLMFHLHKRLDMVWRNEWFRIGVRGQSKNTFSFQEVSLDWEALKGKKVEIDVQLSGKNLMNVPTYGVNSVSDYYSYFQRVRLRPRTFFLKGNLSF